MFQNTIQALITHLAVWFLDTLWAEELCPMAAVPAAVDISLKSFFSRNKFKVYPETMSSSKLPVQRQPLGVLAGLAT
jgi:hypothetical protein